MKHYVEFRGVVMNHDGRPASALYYLAVEIDAVSAVRPVHHFMDADKELFGIEHGAVIDLARGTHELIESFAVAEIGYDDVIAVLEKAKRLKAKMDTAAA
jgi:hypothetical protein